MPEIPVDVFEFIVSHCSDDKVMGVWKDIKVSVYCEEDPVARVGFPDEKG